PPGGTHPEGLRPSLVAGLPPAQAGGRPGHGTRLRELWWLASWTRTFRMRRIIAPCSQKDSTVCRVFDLADALSRIRPATRRGVPPQPANARHGARVLDGLALPR